MSLADLLQWVEATGIAGTIQLDREPNDVRIHVADRKIISATAPIAQAVPLADRGMSTRESHPMIVAPAVLALESLYDQFLDSECTFRFEKGGKPTGTDVPMTMWIREFVMTGIRFLDEWPRINEMYKSDQARIHATENGSNSGLIAIHRAIMVYARKDVSLSDTRLALGISRPSLLRRVDELRLLGRITVDGTPEGDDLITKLIGQASILLNEKQFEEAAHVFGALLAADPSNPMVKALFREAENKQIEALYQELPPTAIVSLEDPDAVSNRRLTNSDHEVLKRINSRWDVSVLVLSSPLREVETLKSLRKLAYLRIVRLKIKTKKKKVKKRAKSPRP